MKLSNLTVNPDNPRLIKDDKFKKLIKSLKDFPKMMELRPIVVDKNMMILGGNMRYRALQELGFTEIPDNWVKVAKKLTEEEKRRFIVEDNLPFGEWDWDILANNFDVGELLDWGFDEKDLKIETETEEDEAPELSEGPSASVRGEIYQLGTHRLMCGDATETEDMAKLMNDKKASMVFTDPPYNVDYVKINTNRGENVKGKKWRYNPIEGDNLPKHQFASFLTDAFANILSFSDKSAPWYVWYAHQSAREFLIAFDNNNIQDRQTIIWVKQSLVIGHSDYQWRHEPCFYLKRHDSGKVPYYGTRRETSVWEISRDNTSDYVHPTQKPVALAVKAIKNSSKDGNIVLDAFGGSGSTLIAAEQTKRICHMMELDPKYCDVIRKRYANFIGKGEEWETATPKI